MFDAVIDESYALGWLRQVHDAFKTRSHLTTSDIKTGARPQAMNNRVEHGQALSSTGAGSDCVRPSCSARRHRAVGHRIDPLRTPASTTIARPSSATSRSARPSDDDASLEAACTDPSAVCPGDRLGPPAPPPPQPLPPPLPRRAAAQRGDVFTAVASTMRGTLLSQTDAVLAFFYRCRHADIA